MGPEGKAHNLDRLSELYLRSRLHPPEVELFALSDWEAALQAYHQDRRGYKVLFVKQVK